MNEGTVAMKVWHLTGFLQFFSRVLLPVLFLLAGGSKAQTPSEAQQLSLQEVVAQTFFLRLFEAYITSAGLLHELAGGTGTIFPPYDPALEALSPLWKERLQTQPQWNAHLQDLLRGHMRSSVLLLNNVTETQTISMSNDNTATVTRTPGTSRVFVDGILSVAHYNATNGVAYMLEDVLWPTWWENTMWQSITISGLIPGSYTTFASWIVAAALDSVLGDPRGNLAVFAPLYSAFGDLDPDYVDYLFSDPGMSDLVEIMRYHIVVTKPLPYPMLASSSSTIVRTLQGSTIELVGSGYGRSVNIQGPASLAPLLSQGFLTNNGLLYPIHKVLSPFNTAAPSSRPSTTAVPTFTRSPSASPRPTVLPTLLRTESPIFTAFPPSSFPVCHICRVEGILPSTPDVVPDVPLPNSPNTLTCRELYELGVRNSIPAALCYPLQNFLEEPCGC